MNLKRQLLLFSLKCSWAFFSNFIRDNHLVRTQNFTKIFTPRYPHKNISFSEYFACVLHESSRSRKARLYNDENVVGMSVSVH